MGVFANDRDLLVFAPNVFRDASWLAARLYKGVAGFSGNFMTAPSDVNLGTLGVASGGVVVTGATTYEISGAPIGNRIVVSRLRGSIKEPILPPTAISGAEVTIPTFRAQIASVESALMRWLGVTEISSASFKVMNPEALRDVAVLRTLLMVYGALGESGAKNEFERERFAVLKHMERSAVRSCVVSIDTDNDGHADELRSLAMMQMVRG
ncbi:MAG: hypothetical protein ACK54H_04755 [Phycisphaerales bacterium]